MQNLPDKITTISPKRFAFFGMWPLPRAVRRVLTIVLALLGPLLAVLTFLVLSPLDQSANSVSLRAIILTDLLYILCLMILVLRRVWRIFSARRANSAGAHLHLTLSAVFAVIALLPTITVAIFATLTINVGLEGWFSNRVARVIGSSLSAATAYETEHRNDLTDDALALAYYFNQAKARTGITGQVDLRAVLTWAQSQIQRGLQSAYVIDSNGDLLARGNQSYLFNYDIPHAHYFERARDGQVVIIQDWPRSEFRALVSLSGYLDRYLYITRRVDGQLLSLLDDTQDTVMLYQQLEKSRSSILFEFALLYLGFAGLLIVSAVWAGLVFAERLSQPVGDLLDAARQVGKGDLDARVAEQKGNGEITVLGRVFNQMTRQLKQQRASLINSNRETEKQHALLDSVLTSVAAGVIGLDKNKTIDFMNTTALRLLGMGERDYQGTALSDIVPEFAHTLTKASKQTNKAISQNQVRVTRGHKNVTFLLRITTRRGANNRLQGYVIAYADITDLVNAQRIAAWGDVARRIAHEIRNPLTPIKLSAEQMQRALKPMLDTEHAAKLEQLTNIIIRQTSDLQRIVDEFYKFSRLPAAHCENNDLVQIVRDVVALKNNGNCKLVTHLPNGRLLCYFDPTLITQALLNVIKNAIEATIEFKAHYPHTAYQPQVHVRLGVRNGQAILTIDDNGIGLPHDATQLFEPYVTTRAKGTGLGLSIVKRIIDQHNAIIRLTKAPVFKGNKHRGARAVIILALVSSTADDVIEGDASTQSVQKSTRTDRSYPDKPHVVVL